MYREKSPSEIFKVRFLDIYMVGHSGYVAGGCFKNIFEGKKIKDVDIFFENEADQVKAALHFGSSEEYEKVYENERVQAFKNKKTGMVVELIRKAYGTPSEMLSQFDFTIVKFAYCRRKNADGSTEFICLFHEDFFEHLACKKLVLGKNTPFPIGTFERSLRYTKYGYGLCRESKVNLIEALQGADTETISQNLYFGFD